MDEDVDASAVRRLGDGHVVCVSGAFLNVTQVLSGEQLLN